MNLIMSHRQNRVKYIKDKFENSISEESRSLPSKPVLLKTKGVQEFKDAGIGRVMLQKKFGAAFEMTDGKSHVKRTPAFRREKLEYTKTEVKTQNPSKRHENFRTFSAKMQPENIEVKTSEDSTVFMNNGVKNRKSDSETNLVSTNNANSHSVFNKLNLLDVSNSDTHKNKVNEDASAQLQMDKSNLEMINTKEPKGSGLKFSESIRRALESPLPKGPPPKKPPRTFCHVSQTSNQSSCLKYKSLNSDLPELKSKLEKLEKVIKTHELGVQLTNSKLDSKCDLNKKSNKNPLVVEKKLQAQVPNKKIEDLSSCLQLSNCLNKCVNDKLSKGKSEFYLDEEAFKSELLDHVVCEMKKIVVDESKTKDVFLKTSSVEPVYEVPCVNKENDFKTFGKINEENTTGSQAKEKTVEGLHYMCTDVVNHTCKLLHSTTSGHSKSLDDQEWTKSCNLKLKFSHSSPWGGSRSTSKLKNDEEQTVGCLGVNLKIQKNNNNENLENKRGISKSTLCYYSSTESDSDSQSVLSTTDEVGHPLKFSREKELNGIEGEKPTNTVKVETSPQMTAKRNAHIKEASSLVLNENSVDRYISNSDSAHLFECCLLVGLTLCDSKKNVPYIKSIFPPDAKPPPLIESLCFPDASYWPLNSESQHPEEQYYSLVITNENGCRKFGYCRRVLPEGGHYCLPLTYCIISPHRANGFYFKVLQELESRHGSPGIEDFIQRLYKCQFPGPGGRLKLMEILEKATQITSSNTTTTLVRRPCDVRLEEKDLAHLLDYLQLSVLLKVFSSLLHERKILFLSNSLRKLSTCSEALHSILLPFSWKHTYIPVLPIHLIEMCDAPTPYVIGLLKHKNVEQLIANINFEEGILVDLDESKIIKCCGDEGSLLPPKLVKDLKTSLNLAVISTNLSDTNRNVLISDAFIRFFVQVCGNYSKFIISLSNGKKIFEKEEFIKSFSNATQSFLEWFTETSMFSSFIQDRLQGNAEDIPVKLFRLRAMEYSGEAMKNTAVIWKNRKVINRKVRTLGDKIKDLTPFTK